MNGFHNNKVKFFEYFCISLFSLEGEHDPIFSPDGARQSGIADKAESERKWKKKHIEWNFPISETAKRSRSNIVSMKQFNVSISLLRRAAGSHCDMREHSHDTLSSSSSSMPIDAVGAVEVKSMSSEELVTKRKLVGEVEIVKLSSEP